MYLMYALSVIYYGCVVGLAGFHWHIPKTVQM